MTVHFDAVCLRVQCQEKMPAVLNLGIVEVQGDLKHAGASETVFWCCCRSKAASQHGQCVCATREEKLIAVVACCTSFFMFLVSASANIGLKKGNKKPSFSIIIPKLAYSPVTRIFFVNKIYPLLFTFLWIDDMTWEDRHHLYFFGT